MDKPIAWEHIVKLYEIWQNLNELVDGYEIDVCLDSMDISEDDNQDICESESRALPFNTESKFCCENRILDLCKKISCHPNELRRMIEKEPYNYPSDLGNKFAIDSILRTPERCNDKNQNNS